MRAKLIKTATLVYCLIFLIPHVVGQNADHHQTNTSGYRLKGRVKSVVIEKSILRKVNGRPVETETKTDSVRQFDESGNLTSTELYSNGKLWTRIIFFRVNGWIARKVEDIDTRTGKVIVLDKNKSRAAACAEKTGFDFRTEYIEDRHGQKTGGVSFNGCGELSSKSAFEYNSNGRLERVIETFEKTEPRGGRTTEYKYDKDGKLTKKSILGLSYTEIYTDYEFDDTGNWTKRTVKTHMPAIGSLLKEERQTLCEHQRVTYY